MAPKHPNQSEKVERPPVVVVMGHIDHGKSSLLDHIRKSSIVASETGGITQRVSAYEVEHTTKDGDTKRVTFLDTPGHEAFTLMRSRSAGVADIAILVVSAEDGAKAQTKEALDAIVAQNMPFVVAISKIDKPNADIMRAKSSLLEYGVYVEGMGGDTPCVPISSKSGEGIDELLDLVLVAAALAELTATKGTPATGVVIEAHREERRGIAATLIIKEGTLRSGEFVVAGSAWAPVRILETTGGKSIKEASFSSPVRVVGFSIAPPVGGTWYTVKSKKEAEEKARTSAAESVAADIVGMIGDESDTRTVIPLILKADVAGMLEAIESEIAKIPQDRAILRILRKGVGAITEGDIQAAGTSEKAIAIGFNVGVDSAAVDLAARIGAEIQTFDIIYRISEWLTDAVSKRTPKQAVEEVTGAAKILKTFSRVKDRQVVGGKLLEGELKRGARVRIDRRGEHIGYGAILGLQQHKQALPKVDSGEFGAEIDASEAILAGDQVQCFITVEK